MLHLAEGIGAAGELLIDLLPIEGPGEVEGVIAGLGWNEIGGILARRAIDWCQGKGQGGGASCAYLSLQALIRVIKRIGDRATISATRDFASFAIAEGERDRVLAIRIGWLVEKAHDKGVVTYMAYLVR